MSKLAATIAVAGMLFFVAELPRAESQVVTTWYEPAPVIGVVPVRRGLFGWRRGYAPVVVGSIPAPVTTVVAPPPVTTYYPPVTTTWYAPAPAVTVPVAPVTPVTTWYAPPPLRVNTWYRPTVIIGR